jgi:hypothetical protein
MFFWCAYENKIIKELQNVLANLTFSILLEERVEWALQQYAYLIPIVVIPISDLIVVLKKKMNL